MSSPCRGDTLTISNLQKHTANETPRTKLIRYFNQFEDPRVLPSHRDLSPIPHSPLPPLDPWEVAKSFFSGILLLSIPKRRKLSKSNSWSKEDYLTGGNSPCPGKGNFSTRVSIRGHRYPRTQSTDPKSFCRYISLDSSETCPRGYHVGVLVVRQCSSSRHCRFSPPPLVSGVW